MPIEIELTAPSRRLFRSTYRRSLPTSFQEVPDGRRLHLWKALLSAPGEAGRVKALRVLLDVPKHIFRALDGDQVAALLEALPWLAAKPDPKPALSGFRYQGRDYFFPNEYGLNLAAIEYPLADEAFLDYMATANPGALRRLCGTLLREGESDEAAVILRGDRRVPLLSRSQAEHRAGAFKKLPDEIQAAALLYFSGVKEFVHNSYGKVLFEQPETDELGNVVQKSTTPSLGWWSLYFSVATEGPFGDLERVYQTGFHQVCLHLVDRLRQQKDAEMRARLTPRPPLQGERG